MSFNAKLIMFFLVLFACLFLIFRYPNSKASKLALTWYGPIPYDSELKSHFMVRWAIYAIGWLVKLIALFAIVIGFFYCYPTLGESESVTVVVILAFTLLAGTAFLGAIVSGLIAFKAKFFGPDPSFTEGLNESET